MLPVSTTAESAPAAAQAVPAEAIEPIARSHVLRFVAGRGAAALADQFLLFAVPLLVYRGTGSVSKSGVVFLAEWLPRVLFLPIAGVLADRIGGYRLYLVADCTRCVLTLAAFAVIRTVPSAEFATLAALVGLMSVASAQAFVAMESSVPRFVANAHMVRAQATIQGTEMVSEVGGPMLAALLAAYCGTLELLACASVIFAFTALNVFGLRGPLRRESLGSVATGSLLRGVSEGAAILRRAPAVVGLVGLTMTVNLMVGVGMATSAALTVGTFHRTNSSYGVLVTSAAVLGLVSFLVVPRLARRFSGFVVIVACYALICGGGLVASRASTFGQFAVGYALLVGTVSVFNVFIRAERIRRMPREHLGKTIGLIVLLNQVTLPLSGFLVAAFASGSGARTVIFGSVVGSVCIALLLLPLVTQLRYSDAHSRPAPNH